MTTIEFDFKKTIKVSIKGHTDAAPEGEDLVCAGISALTVALACALQDAKSQGMIDMLAIDIKSGNTFIKAKPKAEYAPIVKVIFTTIFNGYDALSTSFPDYVSFRQKGVENALTNALR